MTRQQLALSRAVLLIAFAVLAAVAATRVARAQDAPPRSGVVRGEVRAITGERIPYAIVSIVPGGRQRFADDSGAFWIAGIAPGRHRVMARQIGCGFVPSGVPGGADLRGSRRRGRDPRALPRHRRAAH
jgi:hypothetical protein